MLCLLMTHLWSVPCEFQDVHEMEGNIHPGRRSSFLLASPMLAHLKVMACAQGRRGR